MVWLFDWKVERRVVYVIEVRLPAFVKVNDKLTTVIQNSKFDTTQRFVVLGWTVTFGKKKCL